MELCEIGDGNHSSKYHKKSEMLNAGVPFVRGINFRDGYISNENMLYISEEKHQSLLKGHLKRNDVLMTNRGEIGKVCMVNDEFHNANLNSQLVWLRCKDELYHKYLYYYLNSPHLKSLFKSLETGVALKQLPIKSIRNINVTYPPLDEQKRIAEILDKADVLRQKRKQAIAKLDTLLQSIFLDMFGDPITNPKGWAVKKLGDVINIKNGYAFKSDYFEKSGNYALLTPGNFYEKGGFRNVGVKQKFYTGKIPDGFILNQGDLLLAMTEQAPGLLGSPLIVPNDKVYLHNQRLGLVTFLVKTSKEYIFHLFNSEYIRRTIQNSSTGTKVKHTSVNKILDIPVGIPPVELQLKFEKRCEHIQHLSKKTIRNRNQLNTLFNSLQQRAFKGEL